MTTLREDWSKFYFEEGDEDLDVDKIADFFFSRMRGMIEGKRRTDETQMSEDHAYDEALDDLLTEIGE
jgi:hypothetical protein